MQLKRLFLIPMLFFSFGYCQMSQIEDWKPVKEAIQEASSDTWIFFDVDQVLIIPEDPLFHPSNDGLFRTYAEKLKKELNHEELMDLWGIVFSEVYPQVIDLEVMDVLDLVKSRELKSYALTHCPTGKVGKIARFEDWRIKHLKSLGIHFDQLSFDSNEHYFTKMKGKYGIPVLKGGVIFAAHYDKGKVLGMVLDLLEKEPRSIIFIDDKIENLESVELLCKERGTNFIGFEYRSQSCQTKVPLDLNLVDFRFETLKKEKKWLSDDEAEQAMLVLDSSKG